MLACAPVPLEFLRGLPISFNLKEESRRYYGVVKFRP